MGFFVCGFMEEPETNPVPSYLSDIGIARGCLEIVLEMLEQPSADDVRIHNIYEAIQSARNSLLIIEGKQ